MEGAGAGGQGGREEEEGDVKESSTPAWRAVSRSNDLRGSGMCVIGVCGGTSHP